MAEIGVSVGAKVAEYLVAPIARPFSYLSNYKTNLKNLENEVKKLEGRRDIVQHSVEDARHNGEEIEKHVENWLDRVKNIIDEASEFINEDNHQQANMQGFFKGLSRTQLKRRYQHSKKAAGKLKASLLQLQEEGKFDKVSYRIIPEQTCLQPIKGHQAFESRNSILKDIIDALRDPDVSMVGIYGMGGVGKTTLAKEVAREAKQRNLFDKIVFVEVSESPDIKKIQGVIADNLGLQFTEETVSGRANRLYDLLKKEEKIFLILDNLWGSIDFEKVGIPFENDRKGLKLLLTTRSRDMLTNEMDSLCNFHIEALNEADAWNLFKSITGTCTEHPNLKFIALEVAKECGGMPIAIVTIARALKNKEEYEWRKALGELRNPSSKSFGGIAKEMYTSIKLSYDYLENEELKEIFLLCSRVGRTYNASIRDLFRYGLGLGLFEKFNTIEEALCCVYASVKTLKASSLLIEAPKSEEFDIDDIPNDERFAMHDVVCYIARSIAFTDQNVFNVIDDIIPRYWANDDTLSNCISITLHNIGELPGDLQLVCPQIRYLYVKPKDSFLRIPDKFFARMLGLQVLHLIEVNLRPLPTSLCCLVDLQTLCLDECKLGDVAIIGDLIKKLKILSFRGSQIEKLPEQMRHLSRLRLLDLTNCSKLSFIPPKVMSSLTKLEALYMGNTSIQWQVERPNIERSNVSIDELKHLHFLTILEMQIPDAKMSKGLLSPQLERYKIFIGSSEWYWNFHSKTSRMLKLKLDTDEDGIFSQLKEIRELELLEVSGVRNVLYDLDRNGFSELKHLSVKDNSHFSSIVDSKHSVSCDALPSLESLILLHLDGLENICNGQLVGAQFFRQLRTIKVQSCNKLNNIFSFSTDKVLPQLQEIRVSYCNYMEEIFAIGGQDEANNSELVHEIIKFSQLRILELDTLPRLKGFYCKVKTTSPLRLTSDTKAREIISEEELDIPPSLFNEKVSFPNLENLEIYNINVEKIWDNQFPTMSCVQNLTRLIVNDCGNLKELFSSSTVNSFVQLQYLQICKCPLLEEMVVITQKLREGEKRDTFSFRQLNHLIIMDLEKLRRLCYGNYIEFPSLKEMRIESCPQLKEFIFDDKVGFPSLEEMKISLMTNLKMIWHNQVAKDSFCKLKSLEVKYCQKLLTVLPSNMFGRLLSLKSLDVSECASVEEIFDLKGIKLFEERESIASTQSRELCSIFDPQINICFANLQKLKVSECQSMENLFSENLKVAKEEANARLVFPKLTFLELDELPKLRTFYPGRHTVEGPILKELKLQRCGIHDADEEGRLQQPHLFEEVVFPSLETLDVYEIHVEKIWYNLLPIISSSVENLTKLVVYDCGNLRELFSSSMVVTEELRKKERRNTILFPKLNCLEMKYLPKLTRLCSGYYIEFPSLKEFTVHECPELKAFIFDDKVRVPSLEKMKISYTDNLKMIWHNQLVVDSFYKLKSLQVRYCQKLISVLPSNMFGRFSSLESLYVSDCGSLEEIFDLQGINSEERHSIAATQSRDPQIMLSFTNLQNFEVSYCKSLKNLFSVSMVANEEPPTRFLFPKLTSLKLHELPELRALYPARHTVVGPVLKRLELRHCGEESQMQQPLFLVEEAFPCLEELNLAGKNAMIMWQSQLVSECFFHKLKILEVANDESTVLPLGLIQRFPNLEMLSLEESSYQEIFLYEKVQGTPAKMKKLVLYILKDLKYIWNQDSKLDLILQNLEVLCVRSCDSLINLMPHSASFQNLTILEVVSCSSLKNMGSSSTAKSLVQLVKMSISYCEKITEVVGNQGDLTEDKIIFSNLKNLSLRCLPSLMCFCSWNFTLQFPSLEELDVFKCPDMKIFSRGDLTTQILREVKIDKKSVELYPYVDLNEAIQQFHGKANDKFLRRLQ